VGKYGSRACEWKVVTLLYIQCSEVAASSNGRGGALARRLVRLPRDLYPATEQLRYVQFPTIARNKCDRLRCLTQSSRNTGLLDWSL
jgi:hypothetical protein